MAQQEPSLSLEEIEGDRWGPAPEGSTRLVRTVHALRQVPVSDLDTEGLRLLLGQREGVGSLLPLAVGRLVEDPLVEGDLYPGDLLRVVLRLPDDTWRAQPEALEALLHALRGVVPAEVALPDLYDEAQSFLARHSS